jgi:ATP/maltotriose-dependent transcriptional regulator MalT/DNA-binding transcriptional regulator YiaG
MRDAGMARLGAPATVMTGFDARLGGLVRRREKPRMRVAAETLGTDSFNTFGTLLRYLRHRAGLKQRELAARVGYSEAHISRLEGGQRRADPAALAALFVPALGLDRQAEVVTRLLELAERSRTPRGSGVLATAYGIPLPAPCLVPRPEANSALRSLLATQRMVVVCGLPGAGKTTLVAAAAREWAARGVVCWVTATRATAPQMLVRRLAEVLDSAADAEPVPADRQLELLVPAVAAAPVLLCVDDAQQLRDADETLAAVAYLSVHGGLRVVFASREMVPLAGSAMLRLAGLPRDQANALIARLDPDMPAHLGERLAARTDGNPMLLRLALGQARQPGGERDRLVDRLESDPEISTHLIQAALSELSRPATDLVDLLAVFRHGVDLHDEALVGQIQGWQAGFDLPAAVAELQRRQLVDHATSAALHPLIRDHRYARMVSDPRRRRRLHRIAAGCYDRGDDPLEAAWHFTRAGDVTQASDVLTGQVHTLIGRGQNLAAADLTGLLLERVNGGNGELARQLFVVRGDLLVNTVRGAEADAAYREALGHPMPAPVRALVVLRLAESLLERHQPAEALVLCADAAATIGPREALLLARLNAVQAWARIQLSEYDEALPLARRALECAAPWSVIAPELAVGVVARAEWTLGVVLRLRSHADAATHLHRAAAAARSANLHHLAARALLNLGALRWDEGHMTAALEVFGQAEASARATADSHGLARALFNTASTRTQLGELTAAVHTFAEVRALRERLGDTQGVLNVKMGLANAMCYLGRTDEALAELADVVAADWAEPRTRVHALDTQTVALLAAGQAERAVEAAHVGLELASRYVPTMLTTLEAHLAVGQLILGSPELAELLVHGDLGAHHFEAELDTMFLRAVLAHARRDRAAMAEHTAELAAWLDTRDVPLHARTPAHLLAGFDRDLPLADVPRLIWCTRQPDLLAGPA